MHKISYEVGDITAAGRDRKQLINIVAQLQYMSLDRDTLLTVFYLN